MGLLRKSCVLLIVLLLFGCAKKAAPEDAIEFDKSAAQQNQEADALENEELVITDKAAYVFKNVLYGCASYKNEGKTSLLLSEAEFSFSYAGRVFESTVAPVSGESDIVLPGETAYCTLWLPVDAALDSAAPELMVKLKAKPATKPRLELGVADARLIENYPGFATLSGKLFNPGTVVCELNMVYAGFYDKDGALLGVWYFTRNALLKPGDAVAFVVHLRPLPIKDLALNTAQIRMRAFGL
ncbi:MAG TPA: hypothetical protein PKX46_03725 [Clostridia bacterium]|nr:hypothetical protein [Clostridia bacterium]HOR13013.1 hypothetical protein [Clostridia bacterium]